MNAATHGEVVLTCFVGLEDLEDERHYFVDYGENDDFFDDFGGTNEDEVDKDSNWPEWLSKANPHDGCGAMEDFGFAIADVECVGSNRDQVSPNIEVV